MNINNVSEQFLNTIWIFYETNLTPRTRKEYFNVIKNYVKITNNDPLKLKEECVTQYFKYLYKRVEENRLTYKTAQMRISVMRSLCSFIKYNQNKNGIQYENYFADIILPDEDKSITNNTLPEETELNSLLKMTLEKKDYTAFILFTLILKCGLTSSEICSLNVNMLETDGSNLYIKLKASTRKSRTIKLPKDITEIVAKYIEENDIYEGALLYNKRKNPLKIRDAERILYRYIQIGKENGVINKHFTLQIMRHAAIKYMLLGGATEEQVARYCGITSKWMCRYRELSVSENTYDATDYSVITIKNKMRVLENK